MTRTPSRLHLVLTLLLAAPGISPGFLGFTNRPKATPSAPSTAETLPSLRVGAFTGSSGASAQKGLVEELGRSRAFVVLAPGIDVGAAEPSFEISGDSVGGRVSTRLKDNSGKILFERTYAAPGIDENLQALSDDLTYAITGKPGLATSRIVFVSNQTGVKQVYLCNADGSNIQQVTRHRHGAVSPSLSPDASLLAFTSYRTGYPEVTLMDLGGGMERVVTDTPGANFGASIAPDGQHLALVMSFLGNPEIFVTDLSTNSAGCITESIGVPCSPSWSPTGTRLIFSSDEGRGQQLYVADFGSEKSPGSLQRFNVGYRFVTDPAWSPDGTQIAFTARSRASWVVAVKDYPSGRTRVIQRGGSHPSYSPNGRYLIYAQNGDLYRHDLISGSRRLLISDFGEVSEPRWMN
jgi:TolB protein